MKAVILAAGMNNELNSFMGNQPKCMLKIGGETIIHRQIKMLIECGFKVEDIIVVIGYCKEEIVLLEGVEIIINSLYSSTNNSYSLALALKSLDEDAIVMDGDLILEKGVIEKLVRQEGNILVTVSGETEYGATGVTMDQNKYVLDIGKHISADMTYGSIMKLNKEILPDLVDELLLEENLKNWYTIPLAKMLNKVRFKALIIENHILGINSYADYLKVKKILGYEQELILVTGASGFLGNKVYHVLKRLYNVIGIKGNSANEKFQSIDLGNYDELSAFISLMNPNIIIHTAGIADPDTCDRNKNEAYRANVVAVQNLVALCRQYDIKLIHISTDYVFDGEKEGEYQKEDKRVPQNYYGYTKLYAEDIVREYENSLIIRIPILYGYNNENDKVTFPIKILSKLKNDEIIEEDDQQIRYPVLIDEVANVIQNVLYRKGMIHISSRVGVTKFQWAKIIARTYGYSDSEIVARNGTLTGRPMHVRLHVGEEDFYVSDISHGTEILRKQMGCIFKLIYRSFPNHNIYGKNVGEYRYMLGKSLGECIPADIVEKLDYVVPVPTSGLFYAMGMAEKIQVPYLEALIKTDPKERSFQIADLAAREKAIQDKIYAIPELLKGKTVALVDEAIFTGTTLRVVCDMVKSCGAKGIYICIPTPVSRNVCRQYVQPKRTLLTERNDMIGFEEYFKVDGVYFQEYKVFVDSLKGIKNICAECFEI